MTTIDAPAPVEQDGRAATYDLAAEKILLGILMLNPGSVDRIEGVTPEVFYGPRHGEILSAIQRLRADGKPTEPSAVNAMLTDAGSIGRLGGAGYLLECVQEVPAVPMLGYYVDRVLTTAERRNIESAGIRLTQAASAPGKSPAEVVAMAQDLLQRAQINRSTLDMIQLGSLLNPCLDDIETRSTRVPGVMTGFADLDRLLGGLRPKQLITVAGPTGSGKSVFTTDVARHAAIRHKQTVALFTFEMSCEEVFDRVLAAEAGVSHTAIRDGRLTEEDWSRISAKIGPMADAPFFIADQAPMTVSKIRARCERLRARHGLNLVIIDLMHHVEPEQRCADERARLEYLSRALKTLAAGLDVPVLAAAHLNRNPGARLDKTPQLTDLKNSSSVEQDSSVVILLHRPDYYDKDSPRQGEADFIVAKNRSGPEGVAVAAAQLHKSRFVSMAREDEGTS
jgi:replicative DNA helicase